MPPSVSRRIGRNGATMGTLVTSKGEPTIVRDAIGSVGWSAATSAAKMPPRLQPMTCTGRPPACSLTLLIASGMASSTKCSIPILRFLKEISPYSTR